MKELVFNQDGTVAGWMHDGRFVSSTEPLADAVHYLKNSPAVKPDIGKEVPLISVDRNDPDLLDWIAGTLRPVFNYSPRDPADPFVSLVVALAQQGIDDEFSGELVMHKRRWNLATLSLLDYETVACRVLQFVCPQATCRQVGRVGDTFKRESRPDGWNNMICQSCGYRGYGRSLTGLPFMPGAPPIGTPDQIAQTQSEVLRDVLTVEQAVAKRRAEHQQWIERWEETRTEIALKQLVARLHPEPTQNDIDEMARMLRLYDRMDDERAVKVAPQVLWRERYDAEKALKPIVQFLIKKLKWNPETLAERFANEIDEVNVIREEYAEYIAEDAVCAEKAAAANLIQDHGGDAVLTAGELPEPTGVRHRFDTVAAIKEFYEKFEQWDTHQLVLRLGLDGRWAVDVEPLPEEGK